MSKKAKAKRRHLGGGDPYRPTAGKVVHAVDVLSEKDHFLLRLGQLGATTAEVESMAEYWDVEDPTEDWPTERARLLAMDDMALVEAIAASRAEWAAMHPDGLEPAQIRDPAPEPEPDAPEPDPEVVPDAEEHEGTIGSTEDLPQGSVAVLLEWVGTDIARAQAIVAREANEYAPRSTLLKPLDLLINPPAQEPSGQATPAP